MKNVILILLLSVVGLGFGTSASAATTYEVCVRVPDVSDSGSDDDLYVTLFGARGRSGEIELDNPGVDDYNRNTTSCFMLNSGDLGPLKSLELRLRGGDDVCLNNVAVHYRQQGQLKATLELRHHFCLGDDAQSPRVQISPSEIKFLRADGTHVDANGKPVGLLGGPAPTLNCTGGFVNVCSFY